MRHPDSLLEKYLEKVIFASRWLQAPLYVGLIVAQGVYVYQFFVELWELVHRVIQHQAEVGTTIMLSVLGLIDVVMIANLLIMVIIGGYETFVSRLELDDHEDAPEWLSHVNAGALKVKLATALIGISSIHLLKSFIEMRSPTVIITDGMIRGATWQVYIHLTFVASAIALAFADRLMMSNAKMSSHKVRGDTQSGLH